MPVEKITVTKLSYLMPGEKIIVIK